MDISFEEFCAFAQEAIEKGIIKLSPPTKLSELDLAINYAISREMESTGNDTFTLEEIVELIAKWCGMEVYDRVFEIPAEAP